MSQPSRLSCRWCRWTACAVITVFGAEVPDGRLLTSWITGLATHPLLTAHAGLVLPPLGRNICCSASPQIITMFRYPDRPGRMVRMSVPGLIWLGLIPYWSSRAGVATYTVPDQLLSCVPSCHSVAPVVSSG